MLRPDLPLTGGCHRVPALQLLVFSDSHCCGVVCDAAVFAGMPRYCDAPTV